MTKTGLDI